MARKARISIRERVDPLSPAANERRYKHVLLRRDVFDHLAVGDKGNIGVGPEMMWHTIEVSAIVVGHVGVHHGLGRT